MGDTRMTSEKMAHLAAEIMRDPNASELEKSLAGSVLSQADPGREASPEIQDLAGQVMSHSHDFSKHAVSLAASIISQEG